MNFSGEEKVLKIANVRILFIMLLFVYLIVNLFYTRFYSAKNFFVILLFFFLLKGYYLKAKINTVFNQNISVTSDLLLKET